MNIVISLAILISCGFAHHHGAQTIWLHRYSTSQQNSSPAREKRSRTTAQKKIDSHLLYALKCSRVKSGCVGRPTDELVAIDRKGYVRVDIRAKVTPKILTLVRKFGGKVIAVFEQYHSIEAVVPLNRLEDLAQSNEVKFIGLPAQPMTSEQPLKPIELQKSP